MELFAAKYSPDHEAERLGVIDRLYKATMMLELAIENLTGKEAKELM